MTSTRPKGVTKGPCPFSRKIVWYGCYKILCRTWACTKRIKIENNKSVVVFTNGGPLVPKLRKSIPVGILDLRSLGYFKVTYQRLLTIRRKHFEFYHYGQCSITEKHDPGTPIFEGYHQMRDIYQKGRSKGNQSVPMHRDSRPTRSYDPSPMGLIHGWHMMTLNDTKQMLRYYMKKQTFPNQH